MLVDPNVACPSPADVKQRWQDCVNDMLEIRRNFRLNEAFVHGQQWVAWNNSRLDLDMLQHQNAEDAKYRQTVNKLRPRTTGYLARLLRTPLQFEPQPEGVDAEDMRRARISQQVLTVESHRHQWEQVRAQALRFALYGGVSAVAWEPGFDKSSETIPDPATGEHIAMPARPAVTITALSPVEFGIEPGSRTQDDATWWVRATTLTPAQAQERYQLDKEPPADAETVTSAMHRSLMSRVNANSKSKSCMLYVYYHRPCKKYPAGCVVHVIDGKHVQVTAWPFDNKDRLNLFVFSQTEIAGTWKGDTFLTDARPIQVAYNRVYTTINAHLGRADAAKLVVPMGAMLSDADDEWTGEVGEVVRVSGEGPVPQWMQPPQVARWLREHAAGLEGELDDLFSAHMVTRGEAPGDRNSGLALSILAEKDETPLGIVAANQQRGWQVIGEEVLRLNRSLMGTIDRKLQRPAVIQDVLPGKPGQPPTKVEWSAADLPEHPVVHVPLDSVMPRSHAATQELMLRLSQSFPQMFQQMTPGQLATVLHTPDPTAFATIIDPQESLADWENARMTVGAQDEEVEIAEWHDHEVHVRKHNELRASAAYREAPDEVREYIDLHIDAHARLAAEEQQKMLAQQMQQQMMMAGAQVPQPTPDEQETQPA